MRALIDTNILMDFVDDRKEFVEAATKVFAICAQDEIDGYVSAHSLMDLCYLIRKKKTQKDRVDMLRQLCDLFTAVETTSESILAAAEKIDFKDFEDSVVNQAAVRCGADYIITRNLDDFKTSDVPAISPDDFLAMFEEKTNIDTEE